MSKTVVVTHEGRAHADELLGAWFFQVLTGGDLAIVRSSDPALWAAADVLLDCGGCYDPLRGRYDHHGEARVPQPPRSRLSGYATAGLVWLNHGPRICELILQGQDDWVWTEFMQKAEPRLVQQSYVLFANILEAEIVAPIDSWDLGNYPEQGLMKTSLPVQWLLPHLEFDVAMQALGKAVEFRLRALAEGLVSEHLLEGELWEGGPTDFWLWNDWLVIKAEDGKRMDLKAAKIFSKRVLGFPLLAVLSCIRNGTKWGVFFSTAIPFDVPAPPGVEFANGRRAFFHPDAAVLLQFARTCAFTAVLPKPYLSVE